MNSFEIAKNISDLRKEIKSMNFQTYADQINRSFADGTSEKYQNWQSKLLALINQGLIDYPNNQSIGQLKAILGILSDSKRKAISQDEYETKQQEIIYILNQMEKSIAKPIQSFSTNQTDSETSQSKNLSYSGLKRPRIYISYEENTKILEKIKSAITKLGDINRVLMSRLANAQLSSEELNYCIPEILPFPHSEDISTLMKRNESIKSCNASIICLPSGQKTPPMSFVIDLTASINNFSSKKILVVNDAQNLPSGINDLGVETFSIVDYELDSDKTMDLALVIQELIF